MRCATSSASSHHSKTRSPGSKGVGDGCPLRGPAAELLPGCWNDDRAGGQRLADLPQAAVEECALVLPQRPGILLLERVRKAQPTNCARSVAEHQERHPAVDAILRTLSF